MVGRAVGKASAGWSQCKCFHVNQSNGIGATSSVMPGQLDKT